MQKSAGPPPWNGRQSVSPLHCTHAWPAVLHFGLFASVVHCPSLSHCKQDVPTHAGPVAVVELDAATGHCVGVPFT